MEPWDGENISRMLQDALVGLHHGSNASRSTDGSPCLTLAAMPASHPLSRC
jgi:hypothetical protein